MTFVSSPFYGKSLSLTRQILPNHAVQNSAPDPALRVQHLENKCGKRPGSFRFLSIRLGVHALKGNGHGIYSDIQTHDIYWISGIKKNGQDRHWSGSGKIMVDKNVVHEYMNNHN
jgi:hypothetical protein